MSVSLTSNVPGHEGPYNFISEGCPQRMVANILASLWQISDMASLPVSAWHPGLLPWRRLSVHGTLRTLQMLRLWWTTCSPRARDLWPWLKCVGAEKLDEKDASCLIQWWPLWPTADQALPGPQLWCWRTSLAPLLLHVPGIPTRLALEWRQWGQDAEHPKEELQLLGPLHMKVGLLRHLQLPASCAKYLQTYGRPTFQGGKYFFRYEYVDDLAQLRDPLPPYKAFYSSLHGANTLEEGLGLAHGQQNCAGSGCARAWPHFMICWSTATTATLYLSWQPYRSSVTLARLWSWTCSRMGPLCPV